jgi:tetratricopeptide (TPR) repeat protein
MIARSQGKGQRAKVSQVQGQRSKVLGQKYEVLGHRYKVLGTVLLMALVVSGCRQDPVAKAAEFVASADRYVQNRQYKEAILEYRNALEHQPDSASIHSKLARAYDQSGQAELAFASLARVVTLDETNVEANLRVSQALLAAGRFEDARELAERVLRKDARHVDALTIVAMALAATGQPKTAEEMLARAFEIDPHSRAAHLARASWQVRDEKLADAKATLQSLVTLHPTAADAWLALGSLEWQTGETQPAEQSLHRALDLTRDKAGLHRILASYYISVGRAADAETHLITVAPDSDADRLRLAEYYIAAARLDDAERELGVVAEKKKTGPVARLRRAQVRYAQGRTKQADEDLAAALKDPDVEADARLLKSRVLLNDGKVDPALEEARRVAEAHPSRADAAYAVAWAAARKEDWTQAIEWLERTRTLTERPAGVDVQLARVALAAGRAPDAVRYARRAAQDVPSPETHALLARALRASGDLQGAATALASSRRRWPQAVTLELETGYLELQKEQPREAVRAFERAVRGAPESGGVVTLLGMVKQEGGDDHGARAAYERALARDPQNGVAANNLAWLYAKSGRLDEALSLAERANTTLNGAPQTLDTLGWVHYLAGRTDDAIRAFLAALEKQPENPTYHYHLGAAYLRAGKMVEARESLQKALQISPTFDGADAAGRMLAEMR